MNIFRTAVGTLLLVFLTCHLYAVADSLLSDSGGFVDLYGSRTASRVGDVITIVFNEKTVSTQSARGKLKNTFKTGADPGTGLLERFLGIGMSGGETTDVETTTTQRHSLESTMSASIVEVLPNNHYLIEGVKTLEVNHETQKLTVTGVVRGRDITPSNTIQSTQVGDLKARINGLPIERSVKRRRGGVIRWVWNLLF